MLLFASGRTDIPAFYSEWFMNRVRAGFVDVKNPYYEEQVSRYALSPNVVDALVFCTKNPAPMIPHIAELKERGFALYFFVTITPYGKEIEPFVPQKERVLQSAVELSELVGRTNVCWRYDPIFIDGTYTVERHTEAFRTMTEQLNGSTDRCIISFIDLYQKTLRNFPGVREVTSTEQQAIAERFSKIAHEYGISVETCAEQYDLSAFGVKPGACVSHTVIQNACGYRLQQKLPTQNLREHCTCLPMHDIGAYNSCPHLCRYCYANYDERLVRKNRSLHNPASTVLIGTVENEASIKKAEQHSFKSEQLELF